MKEKDINKLIKFLEGSEIEERDDLIEELKERKNNKIVEK